MGMVSAQREVLRFVGMGGRSKEPTTKPRKVVVLMSQPKEFREIPP